MDRFIIYKAILKIQIQDYINAFNNRNDGINLKKQFLKVIDILQIKNVNFAIIQDTIKIIELRKITIIIE